MGDIVTLFPQEDLANQTIIDIRKVEEGNVRRQLDPSLIQAATEEVASLATSEHAAEPIKDVDDILKVSRYLVANGRYRDNMLFIVGINFGLRVSDLLQLRFSMLLDNDLVFRSSFPILEKKTSNTRRVKKNRYITINEAAIDAITMYLKEMAKQGKAVHLSDYLFRGESNRCGNQNKPMSRVSVDRLLKSIAREVGLTTKVSTHTLRKTFGYHQMVMSGNDPRKLLLLQKMFGHSTAAQTLDYIGITSEEIEDAYRQLNLGSVNYYGRMGDLKEVTA